MKLLVVIQWKGRWGRFPSSPKLCSEGSFVFGYRLRSESNQGSRDDTALNDIELYCREPLNDKDTVKIWSNYLEYGSWSSDENCDSGLLGMNPVVGFDVKEQGYQGYGDDTARPLLAAAGAAQSATTTTMAIIYYY